MRGRLPIGHDQHHWLGVRVPSYMTQREHQGMLQIGALYPLRLGLGQLDRRQPTSKPVETDDLQGVLPEPSLYEVVERQRRLLHGPPTPVMDHGKREVDTQRYGCADPPLGFGDLEITDLQRDTGRAQPRPA